MRQWTAVGASDELPQLFTKAGFPDPEVKQFKGTMRLPSIRAWVEAETRGWTLGDDITEAQINALHNEAEEALWEFVSDDGEVVSAAIFTILSATKP